MLNMTDVSDTPTRSVKPDDGGGGWRMADSIMTMLARAMIMMTTMMMFMNKTMMMMTRMLMTNMTMVMMTMVMLTTKMTMEMATSVKNPQDSRAHLPVDARLTDS